MNIFHIKNNRVFYIYLLLGIEIIIFSLCTNPFLKYSNILAILQNSMEVAIIAIGMTIIIILSGIDLAVGSYLGVLAIIAGWLIQAQVEPIFVLLTVLGIGLVIGFISGFIITKWNIPDIIATIGMMYILRSAIFSMLNGQWLKGIPDILGFISKGKIIYIPIMFWILIILYGFTYIVLHYTKIGKLIYAIGSNKKAALLTGIKMKTIRIFCYGFLGALTGFAALLYISRLGSVEITIGMELPIQVIASVIIGGTSILGGSGGVIGTLAGVFFMSVMRNGINLIGIPSLWEKIFIGLFIIISVSIDILSRRSK